jgi:hypothetical protein
VRSEIVRIFTHMTEAHAKLTHPRADALDAKTTKR